MKKGFDVIFTAIRAITDSNKKEVLDLKIVEQQQGFIEPVSHCLADVEKTHIMSSYIYMKIKNYRFFDVWKF